MSVLDLIVHLRHTIYFKTFFLLTLGLMFSYVACRSKMTADSKRCSTKLNLLAFCLELVYNEIAREMQSWLPKIRAHTEYMSDIITTVKGQAVALSNDEGSSFTVGELVKKVNILMKHELKHAIVYLNVKLLTDDDSRQNIFVLKLKRTSVNYPRNYAQIKNKPLYHV